jgi:hypothetical protein
MVVWRNIHAARGVVFEQAAEPLSTAYRTVRTRLTRSRCREEQKIALALMVSLLMIMLQIFGHDTP